jgi:hypothetical protein
MEPKIIHIHLKIKFCTKEEPMHVYIQVFAVLTKCVIIVVIRYGSWMCNQCLKPLKLSLNPTHDEVYLIQHYVIKFVSDL